MIGVLYDQVCRQGELFAKVEIERKKRLQGGANGWEAARWKAVEAPESGMWLDAPPDRNPGSRMSNAEIRSRVSRRLGRKVCDGGAVSIMFWGHG